MITSEQFKRTAEKGLKDAQYNLESLYSSGQGIEQDYGETLRWYLLASKQGFLPAQYNFGVVYGTGEGIIINKKKLSCGIKRQV